VGRVQELVVGLDSARVGPGEVSVLRLGYLAEIGGGDFRVEKIVFAESNWGKLTLRGMVARGGVVSGEQEWLESLNGTRDVPVLGLPILASLVLGPGQVLEVSVRNTSDVDLRVVAGVTGTVEVPG
jgi:hypothetical protein